MKYNFYDKAREEQEKFEAEFVDTRTAEEKKAQLARIWQEYEARAAKRVPSQERVNRFAALAEEAKRFAEAQDWNLEIKQGDWDGDLTFTLPICFFEKGSDSINFIALLASADHFMLRNNHPHGLQLVLSYQLFDDPQT